MLGRAAAQLIAFSIRRRLPYSEGSWKLRFQAKLLAPVTNKRAPWPALLPATGGSSRAAARPKLLRSLPAGAATCVEASPRAPRSFSATAEELDSISSVAPPLAFTERA